jgi:hypothetical protein
LARGESLPDHQRRDAFADVPAAPLFKPCMNRWLDAGRRTAKYLDGVHRLIAKSSVRRECRGFAGDAIALV